MSIKKREILKVVLIIMLIPVIVFSISSFANSGFGTYDPSKPYVKPCDLAEAIDTSHVTTTTGLQNKIWSCSSHDVSGGDSAFSYLPSIGQTWLETTVHGPKWGYFYWKGNDLDFSIDGHVMEENYQTSWSYELFYIPSGTHTVSWHHQKDMNSYPGTAYVDYFRTISWNEVTISGYIKKSNGVPVSGVEIKVESDSPMGQLIHCDSSDSNGHYSCKVPQWWKGRIRPTKNSSSFTPPYHQFSYGVNSISPDIYFFTCDGPFC
jgi:hypothetical protein